jgi:hypothetical protein
MNRDETFALFMQCREAWNAWGEKMLAEHRRLLVVNASRGGSEPLRGKSPVN